MTLLGDPHARSPITGWWNRPLLLALITLAMAVPLLWPAIPPLVDLPGHMARYYVELHHGKDPVVDSFYGFQWRWIGNLGVDIAILPMASIFGLELGTKLIVLTIPVLTASGMIWIAREVHGRVQPTIFFALPLAYAYPFQFGFVNYALAMALTLNAFALWLRWERQGRLRLRAAVFLVFAPILWTVHIFGWAVLCLMAFSAEWIHAFDRQPAEGGHFDRGLRMFRALGPAIVQCLVLAPPVLIMILWRTDSHVGGQTIDWFRWAVKWHWIISIFRDRWQSFDVISVMLLLALWVYALLSPRLSLSRHLTLTALALSVAYALLPRVLIGSAYADMRLAPYILAVAILAIRLEPRATRGYAQVAAFCGLLFFAVRMTSTTISFWMYDRAYQTELAALEHLPRGARLVSFTSYHCGFSWSTARMEHLPALALVRRGAYTNDQWNVPGAQLMWTRLTRAGIFASDPIQLVSEKPCGTESRFTVDMALARFPRDVFQYVWLISPPPYHPESLKGLVPIWRNGNSLLARVDATPAQDRERIQP